jgi:hypothetical protein
MFQLSNRQRDDQEAVWNYLCYRSYRFREKYIALSALSEINSVDVNISTVEDPIEYDLAGINQVQVNATLVLILPGPQGFFASGP